MIKVVFDGDAGRCPQAGQPAAGPLQIIDDGASRAAVLPSFLYARPAREGASASGDCEWKVVAAYPDPLYEDEHGWDALENGSYYYHKGMSFGDPSQLDLRIDCFRAAELFYLHAAERGNVQALINLGYVYGYDRCKGKCWPGWERHDAQDYSGYPVDERAYQVLSQASLSDIPEAHYKLGDMLSAGKGCDQDHVRAYECYERAYSLSQYEHSAIKGSCAFRLATSHEEGRGCEQSFNLALLYYKEAELYLDRAVSMGDYYYRKVLSKARSGIRRMMQELSGQY